MVLITTPSQTFALLLCTCACTWELLVAQSFNYYACADSDYQGIFQFSCSDPTKIISVTSALIGFSDKYIGQTTPPSCPWTSNTSATCNAIGFPQCSIPTTTACSVPCNCTAETTLPAASCIKTNICSFGQTFLLAAQNTPFCLLSKHANFVSVNYTCTNPTTSATSQTMTSTTITTTKLTSTSSAVRSSTSTSTASVTYLPPSQSSSALSLPTVSTSTSFSVTITNTSAVQTASGTTSTTANALTSGAIAGIVVGAVVFVAFVVIIAAIALCCHRKQRNAKGQAVSHDKVAHSKESAAAVGYDAVADVVGWIEHEKIAPATSSGGKVRNGSVKIPTAPADNDTVGLTPESTTDPKGKQGNKTSRGQSSTLYADVVTKKKKSTPAATSAATNRKSASNGSAGTSGNGGIVGDSIVSLYPPHQNRQSARTSTSVSGDRVDTDVHTYANSAPPVAVEPFSISNGDTGNNTAYVSVVHKQLNVDSSNNLTLVDSEVYCNTSASGQQQGQRQTASDAGSSAMNLTLIENSLYSDAI